jgi:hypothetical protein
VPHPVPDPRGPFTLAAADGIVIPVTASPLGLHGLGGFRDWLASFRTDRVITGPVWGVLLTQADLHLADPAAVLVVDETGDLKKGSHTVGCTVSTPAPPARSTTPRSPSTWPTQLRLGMG